MWWAALEWTMTNLVETLKRGAVSCVAGALANLREGSG